LKADFPPDGAMRIGADMHLTIDQKRALAREMMRRKQQGTHARPPLDRSVPSLDAVSEEFYKPEQFPIYRNLLAQEEALKQLGVETPYFNCHTDVSRDTISIDGKSYINYSGYNYLGLSGDPELKAAVIEAVERSMALTMRSFLSAATEPTCRPLATCLARAICCCTTA
jgi:7-keto-8-aminopelargonate synthetase-like enzyme